jgi:alkane 1-monooxygenase
MGNQLYLLRIAALSTYGIVGGAALLVINATQAYWSVFLVPGFFFIIIPLLDLWIGNVSLEKIDSDNDRWYKFFLYLQVPIHIVLFISAIWITSKSDLSLLLKLVNIISFGLLNSQCALIAHEFAHKLGRANRVSAQATLAVIGMGHFLVEHVRGHHVNVCTPEDTASAQLGESIYRFALRDLPGGVLGGLQREGQRLRALGKLPWSSANTVLQSYALSIVIAIILAALLGPEALVWIAIHHLSAWFALTLVTYIEHYGLLRERLASGRYEAVLPLHSWNTNAGLSNVLLFNVQRHSHHHAQPMTPYQSLRDYPTAPQLPTGYFGMIVLAMIPPLWFRVMDRRAVEAMEGRVTRLNLGTAPSRRIRSLLSV